MAIKYHLNPETGETGVCKANVRPCKFGAELHYTSKEAAVNAFEALMKSPFENNAEKTGESYEEIKEEIKEEITQISKLALGRKHENAVEALYDAVEGEPKKSVFGGRYKPTVFSTMNALVRAKRLIGPKGNLAAYEKITAIIARLDSTKEVESNPLYQAKKSFKSAKLPKGSRRATQKNSSLEYVVLPNGRILEYNVRDGRPHFTIRETYNNGARVVDKDTDIKNLISRIEN